MEVTVTDTETGETYRANPARDIAYFLPELVLDLYKRLESQFLSAEQLDNLRSAGIDASRLQQTVAKFSLFFPNSINPDLKTPMAAMTAAGFWDEPAVCCNIVMTVFGQVCACACWAGKRSSVMQGECPPILSVIKQKAYEVLEPPIAKGE
jgi:hypothetical protein